MSVVLWAPGGAAGGAKRISSLCFWLSLMRSFFHSSNGCMLVSASSAASGFGVSALEFDGGSVAFGVASSEASLSVFGATSSAFSHFELKGIF